MGKAEEGGKASEAVETLGGSGDQIWWAVQVFGLEAFLLISRNVVEIRQKSRDRSPFQPELSKGLPPYRKAGSYWLRKI